MPLGLVPSNDRWETQWFESLDTTLTFLKGDLVGMRAGYQVSVMSSSMSAVLGIALSSSTASQRYGGLNKVPVAVPLFGAKAYADVDTGVTASDMSVGKKITIARNAAQGTNYSFASALIGQASRFSAIAQVAGPINADLSRVEVSFNVENLIFYSTSSTTVAS
jgi:hypothetical protein